MKGKKGIFFFFNQNVISRRDWISSHFALRVIKLKVVDKFSTNEKLLGTNSSTTSVECEKLLMRNNKITQKMCIKIT